MQIRALDEVPPAMLIEAARDMLPQVPSGQRDDQRKELYSAVGQTTDEFIRGYELGLQTARTIVLLEPDPRDRALRVG